MLDTMSSMANDRSVRARGSGNLACSLFLAACLLVAVPVARIAAQGDAPAPAYMDDRSTPEAVVESYFNAVNLKQYLRAYSYWEPDAAVSQIGPFEQFQQGYNQTESVQVTTGSVDSGVGAGNLYYSVPVFLLATMTDSSTTAFVGCYTLHLAQPLIQTTPPFRPMGIREATITPVENSADRDALLSAACLQSSGM